MTSRAGSPNLRAIGRSVSLLTAGELVNKAARFGAAIILARILTLEDFGLVNVAVSVAGLLVLVSSLGLPEFGTRRVAISAERPSMASTIGVVVVGRVTVLLSAGVVLLVSTYAFFPQSLSLILFALAMGLGLSLSGDWFLRGTEQMGRAAWAASLGGLVVLLGSILTYVFLDSVVMALTVFVLGDMTSSIVSWALSHAPRLTHPNISEVWSTVRVSWPIGATGLAIYASYANLDVILIGALLSDTLAGLYSAPYRLFVAFCAPVVLFSFSIFPQLSRNSIQEPGVGDILTTEMFRRSFGLVMGYGLMVLGLAILVGEQTLSFFFGEVFSRSSSVLVLLCAGLPFFCIGYPAGYSLIARGQNRRFLIGGASSAGVNLVLLLVLLGPLGIEGAAVATGVGLLVGALVWIALADLLRTASLALASAALAAILALLILVTPSLVLISSLLIFAIALGLVLFTVLPSLRS